MQEIVGLNITHYGHIKTPVLAILFDNNLIYH